MNFKKYHVSKNLFSSTWEQGSINATTGQNEVAGTIVRTKDYIPITPNTAYSFSRDISNGYMNVRLYRADKSYIGSGSDSTVRLISGSTVSNPMGTDTSFCCFEVIDSEVAYIRFNDSSNNTATKWLMVGGEYTQQTMPAYEPYSSEVWHDTPHYIHNTSTDTITTLPAEIYANDTTATVGVKGNMVQNGTPTPENPIMPQGTGERTGNLFDGSIEQGTLNENAAIGTSYNNIKSIPTAATNPYRVRVTNPIYIDRELTVSIDFNSYQMYVLFFDENQKYTGSHSSSWRNTPLTLSGEYIGKYIGLVVKSKQSGNVPISPTDDVKLMLNSGGTALPYQPYGYKIPISSAGQITPVYLGEVESTRRIKKLVLTGQETRWNKSGAYQGSFYLSGVSPAPISLTEHAYCSHAEFTSISTYAKNKFCFNGSPINLNLWIGESSWTTDDFKAYLAQQYTAGTPVTVWYVLATEETGIVNEPLMKIGDYADTVSGISIPTIAGANTISVDTTLQPSEVSVNYKGWHPVADVHEYRGGWN